MSKDDPLGQARPRGKVTLWLDRANMAEARENYWQAYNEIHPTGIGNLDDRHTWDIAFAAAVAAIDYVMAGKVTPS